MYATYSQGFRKEIIIQTDKQMLYLYLYDRPISKYLHLYLY